MRRGADAILATCAPRELAHRAEIELDRRTLRARKVRRTDVRSFDPRRPGTVDRVDQRGEIAHDLLMAERCLSDARVDDAALVQAALHPAAPPITGRRAQLR